jgi:hypothetical protein
MTPFDVLRQGFGVPKSAPVHSSYYHMAGLWAAGRPEQIGAVIEALRRWERDNRTTLPGWAEEFCKNYDQNRT